MRRSSSFPIGRGYGAHVWRLPTSDLAASDIKRTASPGKRYLCFTSLRAWRENWRTYCAVIAKARRFRPGGARISDLSTPRTGQDHKGFRGRRRCIGRARSPGPASGCRQGRSRYHPARCRSPAPTQTLSSTPDRSRRLAPQRGRRLVEVVRPISSNGARRGTARAPLGSSRAGLWFPIPIREPRTHGTSGMCGPPATSYER